MILGGLETGGTKMVLAIGDEYGHIFERARFDSDDPATCMPKMINFFKENKIERLGIVSFGPIDLYKKHHTYGHILKTPKVAWADFDLVGEFEKALNIPVILDTDVNGACLGEVEYGAGKGLDDVVYFTIGTGIGVGVYINGKLQHGLMHPEGGHVLIRRHEKDKYKGKCIFHSDCLEGMASGPAIEERFNDKCRNLVNNKEMIEFESYYLAQGVANAICMYSPEKVIMGGGVMHIEGLIEEVRKKTLEILNGYIQAKEIVDDIDNYVVLPKLGDDAGILGALKLATFNDIEE